MLDNFAELRYTPIMTNNQKGEVMTTLEELKGKIREDMEQELPGIVIHDAIKEILKEKWIGKQLNKRIEKQIKEKLTQIFEKEPTLYYNLGYSTVEINIWGLPFAPDAGKKLVIYLGYVGHEVTLEAFERTDACHGEAAKERNVNREALLNDPETLKKIADAVEGVRKNWEILHEITERHDTPAYEVRWIVDKMTGLEERRKY